MSNMSDCCHAGQPSGLRTAGTANLVRRQRHESEKCKPRDEMRTILLVQLTCHNLKSFGGVFESWD